MNTRNTLSAVLVALLLAACGGGEDEALTQCIGGFAYDSTGTPAATSQTGQVTQLQAC